MSKIYLAGPMRGYPRYNFPQFDKARIMLRAEGHEVFCPAEKDRITYGEDIEHVSAEEAARRGLTIRKVLLIDLEWICQNAQVLALLPNWRRSAGALAEYYTSKAIGVSPWILPARYHLTTEP